jgi:hypothetical protein
VYFFNRIQIAPPAVLSVLKTTTQVFDPSNVHGRTVLAIAARPLCALKIALVTQGYFFRRAAEVIGRQGQRMLPIVSRISQKISTKEITVKTLNIHVATEMTVFA